LQYLRIQRVEIKAYQRKSPYLCKSREYCPHICSCSWQYSIKNRVAKASDEDSRNWRIGIAKPHV